MIFVNTLAARARRWTWLPALACFFSFPLAAQEQCNWNNNAVFPLCTSAGITNPDGWGWENNASCISRDLCTSNQNSGGVIAASSASSSTNISSSSAASLPSTALGGWRVSGSQILDPNGQVFVFRGVNHAHTWYASRLNQSIADIAAAGANSVRVVLSNGTHGQGWSRNNGADVSNVINQCKLNKLVCVLEVHDSTGYGENAGATHISKASEYWLSSDIRAAIDGQESYVIVNIANEPFGNTTSTADYVADTKAAITALRSGGITHMLMVDGSTWGQDWQGAMRDNAAAILAADSYANVVFSVHMYEVYDSASKVQAYINSFVNNNLALVVGEFGHEHNSQNVAEEAILQYAEQQGIGYLGWSWSGNGSCCTSLDIVTNWNPNNFSTWGDILFNSTYGIKATAQLASIFTSSAASSSASSASSLSSAVASASSALPSSVASSSVPLVSSASSSLISPPPSSASSSEQLGESSSSAQFSSMQPSSAHPSSAQQASSQASSQESSSQGISSQASSSQVSSEQASSDQASSDQASSDQASSEQASSDQASSEQTSSQQESSAGISSATASSSSAWVISSSSDSGVPSSAAAVSSSAASAVSSEQASSIILVTSASSQQASSQAPEPGGSASSQAASSVAPQSSAASSAIPASSTASSLESSTASSNAVSSQAVSSQAVQNSSAASSATNSGSGGGGSMPWQGLALLVLFLVGRRLRC